MTVYFSCPTTYMILHKLLSARASSAERDTHRIHRSNTAALGREWCTLLLEGAPAHSAKEARHLFSNTKSVCSRIAVAPAMPKHSHWSSSLDGSPDLNPIGHAWAWLQQKLYLKQHEHLSFLWRPAMCIWNSMPLEMCNNLTDSTGTTHSADSAILPSLKANLFAQERDAH